jgi:soluble lytic murein transglycosylase-like protein
VDIKQIPNLTQQSLDMSNGNSKSNDIDKSQAFTIILDEMLQLMTETINQEALNSPDLNMNATSSYGQSMGNEDSNMENLSNSSQVPGLKSISSQITNAIDAASSKYNVEKPLIEAVIQQESAFNPNAVSTSGAQGLMQLMPSTAKSLGVTNSFNADQNIDAGTKYLKTLLDNFNGNKSLALSAYNGGIGTMQNRNVKSTEDINKMPNETSSYVKKVIGYYEKYKV